MNDRLDSGDPAALSSSSSSTNTGVKVEGEDGSATKASETSKRSKGWANSKIGRAERLKGEIEILGEYIQSEIILGQCSTARLNELKSRRDKARRVFIEFERAKMGLTLNTKEERDKLLNRGIYTASSDLVEKCHSFHNLHMPVADEDLKERSFYEVDSLSNGITGDSFNNFSGIGGGSKGGMGGIGGGGGGGDARTTRFGRRSEQVSSNMSTEFHLSMTGLPSVARDFLSKLPLASAPALPPDIELFIRHMKNVILPPRPSSSEDDGAVVNHAGAGDDGLGDGNGLAGVVEDRKEEDEEGGRTNGNGVGSRVDEDSGDIFRRRQRARLNA